MISLEEELHEAVLRFDDEMVVIVADHVVDVFLWNSSSMWVRIRICYCDVVFSQWHVPFGLGVDNGLGIFELLLQFSNSVGCIRRNFQCSSECINVGNGHTSGNFFSSDGDGGGGRA